MRKSNGEVKFQKYEQAKDGFSRYSTEEVPTPPLKIVVIGAGYVGLVTGAGLAEFGHRVTVVDVDLTKIERLGRGEMPIYEPGLDAIVARNAAAGRLTFTINLREAMQGAVAVFIAVGTPTRPADGLADLSHVYRAAGEIALWLHQPCVIVCKSTVPVGTTREVLRRIRAVRPDAIVDVASNPEFLREGAAIDDFMNPDRVVIGAETGHARLVLSAIYSSLALSGTPFIFTGLETAELVKYSANAFLATKITFINEIADLCEKVGADVRDVARAIGSDARIGPSFLRAGPGYGGSCFPKDLPALAGAARKFGAPLNIIETVIKIKPGA